MLPVAVPLGTTDAGAWAARPLLLRYGRYVLIGLWVVCVGVALAFDTPCSAQDPSICGPDLAFAWAAVPLLATPVLLLWMPLAGCVAGMVFAVLDVLNDDVHEARVAFLLHGLICLAFAVRLVSFSRAQRAAAERLARGYTFEPRTVPFLREAGEPPLDVLRLGLAALLVVAGLGCLGWYRHAQGVETAHIARALTVPAEVTAVDEGDATITLRAPEITGGRKTVEVLDTGPYPLHSTTPVLVDPQDPAWLRLVAEPQDISWWISLGLGALLLAALLVGREAEEQFVVRRFLRGRHPVVRVRVVDDGEAVHVLAAEAPGAARPERLLTFARLDVPVWFSREPLDSAEEGAVRDDAGSDGTGSDGAHAEEWTDEEWTDEEWNEAWVPGTSEQLETSEAVLAGDLRDRGWATLLVEDEVLPVQRLRVGRRMLGGSDVPGDDLLKPYREGGHATSGGPTSPESAADETSEASAHQRFPRPDAPRLISAEDLRRAVPLPHFAALPPRARALGNLAIAGAYTVAPIFFVWVADGWFQRLFCVVVGAEFLASGVGRARQGLWLRREHLEIVGTFRSKVIPWGMVRSVYTEGERLAIAWRPDEYALTGPFEVAGARDGKERAEQLGAQIMAQRGWAPASETRSKARTEPGPVWWLLIGYAAVMGIAAWWVYAV